jgi:hypothetical protein
LLPLRLLWLLLQRRSWLREPLAQRGGRALARIERSVSIGPRRVASVAARVAGPVLAARAERAVPVRLALGRGVDGAPAVAPPLLRLWALVDARALAAARVQPLSLRSGAAPSPFPLRRGLALGLRGLRGPVQLLVVWTLASPPSHSCAKKKLLMAVGEVPTGRSEELSGSPGRRGVLDLKQLRMILASKTPHRRVAARRFT